MAGESGGAKTWRSCQGDLSDAEWALIADLVPTFSGGGRMGRPATHAKRDEQLRTLGGLIGKLLK